MAIPIATSNATRYHQDGALGYVGFSVGSSFASLNPKMDANDDVRIASIISPRFSSNSQVKRAGIVAKQSPKVFNAYVTGR